MKKEQETESKKNYLKKQVSPIVGYSVMAAIAVLLVGGFFLFNDFRGTESSLTQEQPEADPENLNIDRLAEVDELEGDIEQAIVAYEGLIAEATEDDEKVSLYSNIIRILIDEEEYARAEDYARQSLEIKAREDTYTQLAVIQLGKGNQEAAIDYYQQAVDLHQSRDVVDSMEVEELQRIIEELRDN